MTVAALLQEAVRLHQKGQLPEAERLYRSALAQEPTNFDGLYLLGLLTMQKGEIAEAVKLASAALARNPQSFDVLSLLGSLMLTLSRFDDALGFFERAVAIQPKNINARYNRAVALGQAGRAEQALAAYDEILAVSPAIPEAWLNKGNVLAQLARYEEAVESFDRALALKPGDADMLNNRGSALAALGRHEAALASFDQALRLLPESAEVLSNRAISLKGLGRLDEARGDCERALAGSPDHVRSLVTLGNILHAIMEYDGALRAYDRALSLTPNDAMILSNRSLCLFDMGRFPESLAEAERAIAHDATNAEGHFGRAKGLQAVGRHREAIAAYEKAIALQPNLVAAKWNLGICYLRFGRFDEGWSLYDNRWDPRAGATPHRGYSQPRWDGKPIAGPLLIWGDQGLGDQIIYASIIPELKACAGRIVIELEPRLVSLFARSFPDAEIVAAGPELYRGPVEAQTSISGLPAYFRKSFDAFPQPHRGFLVPDPDRVGQLRGRLAAGDRAVIGLTWISKNPKIGRYKSAALEDLAPLLQRPGFRFIDLQYGDTAAERQTVERKLGVRVERLEDIDNTNDIDGLAALIAACDAVLTVSSTTAHLAGAVGAPTFVMVPFGAAHLWYWFESRPASPWYPRVQVCQQVEGQPWSDLVSALTEKVAAAATDHRKRGGS